MALSVDYIYKYLLDLMLKNQAGGLGNEQFERYWNGEQAAYQNDLLGPFQARNNGKAGANTGLIQNETIMQKLTPFISKMVLLLASGTAKKPTDFIYRLSLQIDDHDCKKINYNQRATVLVSVIDPPSAATQTYYFLEYEDYYEFLPSVVSDPVLDYIKTPPNIKWGFDFDADGQHIYNDGTSIQPLWNSNDCREICKRVMKTIGVAFKDNDFASFGNSVIKDGD